MLVLVHVVYSLSRSIASRNLTGWEWLGIALFYIRVWLSKLGHFFLPMSPQMLISGRHGHSGRRLLYSATVLASISQGRMRVRRHEEDGSLALIYFAQFLLLFTFVTNYCRRLNFHNVRCMLMSFSHDSTGSRLAADCGNLSILLRPTPWL